jgi:hypothetical protein
MPLTRYTAKKLQDHYLGLGAYTAPSVVYLVLFTGDPTATGILSQEIPAGVGYARINLTALLVATSLAQGESINGSTIQLGPATADWGDVSHWGTSDSGTISGGNLLTYDELLTPMNVVSGDSPQITEGALVLRLKSIPD